jgi:D-erythritol 1-phosphate dehydrogenase
MADLGTVDLLVIGGGVNGAGIARDAVGRGLSVVLCEKGDLAEGTSSRSGKLVHGGLRYLEHYEFGLVREALIEREVLLETAPHIIWPMRFVLPHSPEQRPAWMLWLGLFLYDHLGGRKRLPGCRRINLRAAPEGHIIRDEFRLAFEYSDCWVDDARLVVLNALDARQRGAAVLTRTIAKSARRVDGLWELDLGEDGNAAGTSYRLRARAIVNAAGPWVENVIGQVARLNSRRRVRLVKGSHIVVKKFWDGPQAYLFQNDDKRVIFVNPYEDDLCLIGTTDVAYAGAAEDVVIDDAEIDYLLAAVNRYVTHELRRADVQYAYSGVRPLYDDNAANPSAVTRDYVFDTDGGAGRAPLLSVFGGKITTYRKLAEHAMAELAGVFPRMGGAWTARIPLPGGDLPDSDFSRFLATIRQRHSWLPAPLAQHYARLYGTRIDAVLGSAGSLADLGRHFGGLLYEREARYLRDIEWAQTADDILLRRTKHGLHLDRAARDDFANWL